MKQIKSCPCCGREASNEVSLTPIEYGNVVIKFKVYCPVCGVNISQKKSTNYFSFEELTDMMNNVVNTWNARIINNKEE